MSSTAQRTGVWEPLPLIVYGYAIHPLTPSRRDTRVSHRNRLSTVTEASNDDHLVNRDVVSLEVGDEVYAFERYTPRGKEVEGSWYRGYVVCTMRRPPVDWSISDPSSSFVMKSSTRAEEPQQVFIGIFPASHIHIRDELSDAEGRLADVAASLKFARSNSASSSEQFALQWKEKVVSDGSEEDFDLGKRSFRLGPPPEQANSSRAGLAVYPASVRSSSPEDSQLVKPLPPRPSLKSGDDTASGISQPIVDEIAAALREWHALMFQYLARRDYKLFHTVREHIEILHQGRRQILAQTLSTEETSNLRRDCVARLVSGNIVQGLDVIVRHPTWGGLVTVDVEGEIDSRSWMSAVRMYAMQTSLAYANAMHPGPTRILHVRSQSESASGPQPTPAHSAFSDYPHLKKSKCAGVLTSTGPTLSSKATTAKFYHIFLDVRAFVASPCSPGETAELFFSLYNKAETRFVTEEFCAILNHNGVLARDPTARIRALFVDLAQSDVQDPIYLVCKIVRNGALKISGSFGSGMSGGGDGKRGWDTSTQDSAWENTAGGRGPLSPDAGGFFRRPFGCAVLELTQLSRMTAEQLDISPTKEYSMPIFVPVNEALFSMLHQDVIADNTREYEKSSRAEMLAVSIKIFHGDSGSIIRENSSLLQGAPLALRLGFPDVVFPEDVRNELYIKLWSGDFYPSHGGGRLSVANFARVQMGPSVNNVQVTIEVRDQDGRTVEDVISQGSGEPLMSQFHSMVFQKCNQPTFGELIKIQLPLQGFPDWHLFLTFRNRGRDKLLPRSGTDSTERPFAFAFQPLFPDKHAFVEDGHHTLVLYRADKVANITPNMYLSATPLSSTGQKTEQPNISPEMQRIAPPIKDSLTIRTSLCSTKFTQSPILLHLLKGKKLADPELLSTVLKKFTFIGEGEIVKFLRDIFDSLFSILVSQNNQDGEMDGLVFDALVIVLGIVQDRRFSNFQPVLDVYIEKHFNYPKAASHIIHSMNRLLADPTSNESATPLRAALKVWHYIFKFIARSRELQKATELSVGSETTAEHLENSFMRDLRAHLAEVTRMMAITSPASIIGTQTIALQHFTSILPELGKIFTTVELVTIATNFANALVAVKGKIVIWKLIMYLQIVKGHLFDHPESRPLLVEAVVIWIKPHFGRFDEYAHTQSTDANSTRDAIRVSWLESIRLSVGIIAIMLDKLQTNLVTPEITGDRQLLRREQDNIEYLLSLLPKLLESYREFQSPETQQAVVRTPSPATVPAPAPVTFPESYPFSLISRLPDGPVGTQVTHDPSLTKEGEALFNPGLGEIAVVFLALVLSSPRKHMLNFLESSLEIEGRDKFITLVSMFFKVSASILENDAFPRSWLNVNILAHKVLIRMMDPIATLLERDFVPDPESEDQFELNLWREGFYLLLMLLSSEQLVIEEFSPQKRRAVWRLAGDVRGEGATILLRLWEALDATTRDGPGEVASFQGYQVFFNNLVGHVVHLCLSHHDQLRSNAVTMLFSMIISEYQQSGHFEDIENELVNRLDSLFMSDSKGDDVSRAFFIGQLRHLFDSSEVDEGLRERVSSFLDSVDLFLELLLSVRALPAGEEFADDRVIATLRLMNFIRRIGRDEIYIKYVHQLVNMHLQSQNFVEAALTLKLHSDLHEWDLNSFVAPMEDLGLPQQSQFHRKETLCLLILDYLGKGKAWESAIEICKELAYQHSEVTYNYARLSEILRHQAALLEHIVTDQRYYSEYFRVAFYGNFPVALRGKHFIYRGYEWEKFGAFCERMLNKHPGAQLLKTAGDPPVEIRFGNDQYIQCTTITPEPDRTLPVFNNPSVPAAIRTYYENSAVNTFSSSRPFTKSTRDGSEVWIEKAYFTTEDVFPTVLRRSEIISVEVSEISPVENALTEVEGKTKELSTLHVKYSALAKTTQAVSTNALAMMLNSVVDGPPDQGVFWYRTVFFNPAYAARHPDRAELVENLRKAIDEQARMIHACLKLHAQLCPQDFILFHETLENFFRKNFSEEIRRLGIHRTSDQLTVSMTSYNNVASSQYQSSEYEHSIKPSSSSVSTSRQPFSLPPLQLQLGRSAMTPPALSPRSNRDSIQTIPETTGKPRQTPLQRHLAHLARHGIMGVASGPRENAGSDSVSAESPQESVMNVGNGNGGTAHSVSNFSAVTSTLGSVGSLKDRLTRLGSVKLRKRG